jgi:hypothetical protein
MMRGGRDDCSIRTGFTHGPYCGSSACGSSLAANGACVDHFGVECLLSRMRDGEGDTRDAAGPTLVPLTASGTAKGTIVSRNGNACRVVGWNT